jgi:hypothetical protein
MLRRMAMFERLLKVACNVQPPTALINSLGCPFLVRAIRSDDERVSILAFVMLRIATGVTLT